MRAANHRVVIIGGGAAGFFAALSCKEANPAARVSILEASAAGLSKVRISGGGRCNVTHDEPDPARLVLNYPRGGRALRGPMTRFGPRETIAWFQSRGVELKTEADGRMFPITDDSQTIISCLVNAARAAGVEIRTRTAAVDIDSKEGSTGYLMHLKGGESLSAERLMLAPGGAPAGYRWAAKLGHVIEPPVPSLFTFNIDDPRLEGLAGVSVPRARVRLDGTKDVHEGPLLVTHWGLTGPAVLRASAWGARTLHDHGYRMGLTIDWLPDASEAAVNETLAVSKQSDARRTIRAAGPLDLPQRLWRALAQAAGVEEKTRWADASKPLLAALTREVKAGHFQIAGKGVFKEEFVTCGGVRLKEVDFGTMESRIRPGLHFAGEILDIDGVTGGFNFQSAWTTGWLAGRAMAERPAP